MSEDVHQSSINYRDEVLRKMIHLCSLSIPIIAAKIGYMTSVTILVSLAAFAVIVDLSRYVHPAISKIFYKVFGFMLREHEVDLKKKNLNGATYVLLSALLCLIIFPPKIFATAFSVLIISDSSAALIGRKFGRHKLLAKSLEGTLAFFVSAIIVVFLTPKVNYILTEYIIAFFAVAVGAIVENVSYGWADDNFTIPITIGFIIWGGYLLFLPELLSKLVY